jgi:hypothetical protein
MAPTHRQEKGRLAILATDVGSGAMLEELSKHLGMISHSGVRECRHARALHLEVYVSDVESLT